MTKDDLVVKYLHLVNRRLFIIINSGIGWMPEYVAELTTIDDEICKIRKELEL